MNHPTKLVLCFGIVLLVMALAFAAVASASSDGEPLRVSSSQVLMLQGPPTTYTLTVSINPIGSGSVTKNPNQTVYISGTTVALSAVPASGYKFDHWSGDVSGLSVSASIVMTANRSVTANFALIPPLTSTATATASRTATATATASRTATGTATATSQPTSTAVATSTTSPYATITPLPYGVVVATAAPTVTPIPSSGLPPTGASPLMWIGAGLALVLIALGARYVRQSSA